MRLLTIDTPEFSSFKYCKLGLTKEGEHLVARLRSEGDNEAAEAIEQLAQAALAWFCTATGWTPFARK